ncbi:hypothetical protein A3A09_02175 [Candidatus Nomurabacteria bacterium RIFCSPLOWO2_01_FULL_42_20]|nr:MAG: hypothetical protein A3A09_02175 [Candidatus Nomurabacteria bacterium RIFCSPLOWO2_01_FULL_42_20]
MSINKKVGENISKLRKAKKLSQGELAKILGVNRSYISTLENGSRNPSVETLQKIAKALDSSVAKLTETSKYENSVPQTRMPYVPGLIKSQEKLWQGKSWYHQRFDGAPYLIHMIAEAEILTRRDKKYGLFFDRHFCFFEEGRADWYIDIFEIERVTKTILSLVDSKPNFSQKIIEEYKPLEKAFYHECEIIGSKNLYSLSDTELIDLHDHFIDIILNRNSSSSIIDGFALGTDRLLEEKIKKAYENSPTISKTMKFSEVFSALTAPTHYSFLREAELELFKLILEIRKHEPNRRKLIENYRDRFFWIRNNYVDVNILTISYFEEEIARIESSNIDVAKELERLEQSPDQNKKAKKDLMRDLPLDKETLFLIKITEDFTYWQDERKKATLFTAHYATLILDEISRRLNIPTNLLKYMTPREVSRIFTDTPPIDLLEERRRGSALYWDETGHEVITGSLVETLRKTLLGEKNQDDIQDFRGLTASLGKAQGKVRVLKSVKEINKIKEGEILVAVMTRPDYVPAMKKAAAIVTDEGGITSHAAIVSRELKIPCVIGTKIATHVLKDGDLVEVNANHGLVKILKRA